MVVTLAAMLRQHRRFRRQRLLQAGEITHLSEEERKRVTPNDSSFVRLRTERSS
jgi:hypothetical protein